MGLLHGKGEHGEDVHQLRLAQGSVFFLSLHDKLFEGPTLCQFTNNEVVFIAKFVFVIVAFFDRKDEGVNNSLNLS